MTKWWGGTAALWGIGESWWLPLFAKNGGQAKCPNFWFIMTSAPHSVILVCPTPIWTAPGANPLKSACRPPRLQHNLQPPQHDLIQPINLCVYVGCMHMYAFRDNSWRIPNKWVPTKVRRLWPKLLEQPSHLYAKIGNPNARKCMTINNPNQRQCLLFGK